MNAELWLRDLGFYGVQIALLVGAGAALARAFHLHGTRAALIYWRAMLLACLLLPACQRWQPAAIPAAVAPAASVGFAPMTAAPASPVLERAGPSGSELALAALLAGAVLRGLWLAIGAVNLAVLRRTAMRLEPLPDFALEAQQRLGTRATFYLSDRVGGPATFGILRPAVVLPPNVLGMDGQLQRAIAFHELLHVRRGDWLTEIIEEIVRSVFWFHPGIRWLVSRIQLSREQVVDRAAIDLVSSRERYVEALLAVARGRTRPSLVPAPLFLRRSLLKVRIAHILQETTMSTRRSLVALGSSAAVLALAAVLSVRAFPLQAQAAQTRGVAGGAPVQVLKGADHLLHGDLPEYPRRAIEQRVEGDVLLDVVVDERGEVSDARVLSGPDELRKASLEAVLRWHYSPEALRSTSTQVALHFAAPAAGEAEAKEGWAITANDVRWKVDAAEFKGRVYAVREDVPVSGELTPVQRAERKMVEIGRALEDPNLTPEDRAKLARAAEEAKQNLERDREVIDMKISSSLPARLVQVRKERVADGVAAEILKRAGISIGDTVDEQAARRIGEAAAAVDEHIEVLFSRNERGELVLGIIAR
jgi:TonB family protein